MCCTASCVFIHSLHEKGGTPSTDGPFTAHTPIFLLWSDVDVTLLSIAPKCRGLLVSRSYLDAMTYVGSHQFAYVARIALRQRIVQIIVRAQNLQESLEILHERLEHKGSVRQKVRRRAGRCCVASNCSNRSLEWPAATDSPTSRRSRGCTGCCTTPSSPISHSWKPWKPFRGACR